MAAATALSLSACQDDPNNPETSSNAQSYDAERLISIELPVTRNGADFNVSVNAYCNTVPKAADYAQNCTAAAAQAMEQKFMCDSFALATGNTRTNNKAVVEAGSQRTYDEFPSHYLFTQEKLETVAPMYNKEFNKKTSSSLPISAIWTPLRSISWTTPQRRIFAPRIKNKRPLQII